MKDVIGYDLSMPLVFQVTDEKQKVNSNSRLFGSTVPRPLRRSSVISRADDSASLTP